MDWTLTDTLALAHPKCKFCRGMGLRPRRNGTSVPCRCVFRAIFRACYDRFREAVLKGKTTSLVTLDSSHMGGRRITWGRKSEEFAADFILVTRRNLSPQDYRLFSYHLLLGADWRLCSKKLGIDQDTFFHRLYSIQERLGRAFRELQPYSLFPIDEYFSGKTRNLWPEDSVFNRKRPLTLEELRLRRTHRQGADPRNPALGRPLAVPLPKAA